MFKLVHFLTSPAWELAVLSPGETEKTEKMRADIEVLSVGFAGRVSAGKKPTLYKIEQTASF